MYKIKKVRSKAKVTDSAKAKKEKGKKAYFIIGNTTLSTSYVLFTWCTLPNHVNWLEKLYGKLWSADMELGKHIKYHKNQATCFFLIEKVFLFSQTGILPWYLLIFTNSFMGIFTIIFIDCLYLTFFFWLSDTNCV